jgi:hypothetical protein
VISRRAGARGSGAGPRASRCSPRRARGSARSRDELGARASTASVQLRQGARLAGGGAADAAAAPGAGASDLAARELDPRPRRAGTRHSLRFATRQARLARRPGRGPRSRRRAAGARRPSGCPPARAGAPGARRAPTRGSRVARRGPAASASCSSPIAAPPRVIRAGGVTVRAAYASRGLPVARARPPPQRARRAGPRAPAPDRTIAS